jgi:catalase
MATRKRDSNKKRPASAASKSSARSTVSGPSNDTPRGDRKPAVVRKEAVENLAASTPYNDRKAAEYGDDARHPAEGATAEPETPLATGSTLTEENESDKTGSAATTGLNPTNHDLNRVRVDSGGQRLSTNQGTPIGDNQNSLRAGPRGPGLIEDFILREKITHFDHERIPERVVHARGSGAHGYFECLESLAKETRASVFAEPGRRTPVFVRFSTVVGERGSADTVRDVRGFAMKFYTDEGNWDLVGNNMPVFFIQDAMKFPDLIHAAKPEPHFAMPQAATAHDTFWDFVSLTPESTHMLMWAMSDRALPRSYRMMQGFGVHTFRFINSEGASVFVKFHLDPVAGTHSLDWDEAVKIAGADPDFHRRDLWEAIEAGEYPEWDFGVQIFSEEEAQGFTFDVLDATKIVPEELVPVQKIGRLVLDRNPDNFFAETEQVAFCAAHLVPGIDFSNDPLLAGRIHSYQDTQLLRLGGPNFHEIPINTPIAQVHNNTRDGFHRQAIHRGRVAYEPNSLGGGSPFQAGPAGFASFPEAIADDKVRGKPEKFAEHFAQATLFWESQTPIEKAHIVRGFRFELSKVQSVAVRTRTLAMLENVSEELASQVAEGLGLDRPEPMPRALANPPTPEITRSPALSLLARPGDGSIRTRRVAILVADGVDVASAALLHEGLTRLGAVPRFVGTRLGALASTEKDGEEIDVEVTFEATPSVLYDAMAIPDGEAAAKLLSGMGQVIEFIKDQFRHCKPMLAVGSGVAVLQAALAPAALPTGDSDSGVLAFESASGAVVDAFALALARHRHFDRAEDPPSV